MNFVATSISMPRQKKSKNNPEYEPEHLNILFISELKISALMQNSDVQEGWKGTSVHSKGTFLRAHAIYLKVDAQQRLCRRLKTLGHPLQ